MTAELIVCLTIFSHRDVDRDVPTVILNNCRETTSAIFSFRTDEQNRLKPFERMPQFSEQTFLVDERMKKLFERYQNRSNRCRNTSNGCLCTSNGYANRSNGLSNALNVIF